MLKAKSNPNATALITGATSGIGKALAEEHSKMGWNLILIGRKSAELADVQKRCSEINSTVKVTLVTADVTQKDFIEILKAALVSTNDLKLVYANAGIGAAGRFEKLTMADFHRVHDVNVNGVLQTLYGCLPALKASRGRIVLLGSLNSFLALPLGAPYNMSKFAVRALGETLNSELAPLGIGVSVVCPGPVRTNIVSTDNQGRSVPDAQKFFASKPAMQAQTAARRIIRGALCGKGVYTLNLSSFLVIGLQKHFSRTVAFLLRTGFKLFEDKIVALVRIVNPDSV
jgi:short-subunit dehydrogenase